MRLMAVSVALWTMSMYCWSFCASSCCSSALREASSVDMAASLTCLSMIVWRFSDDMSGVSSVNWPASFL